jgi:hypothetical protein
MNYNKTNNVLFILSANYFLKCLPVSAADRVSKNFYHWLKGYDWFLHGYKLTRHRRLTFSFLKPGRKERSFCQPLITQNLGILFFLT